MASTQVSQVAASSLPVIPTDTENRPKADFHPGIWGDMFINDIDAATELQFEELKEQVRKMIVGPVDDLNQKLAFIDAVQRLGVSYHFEKEIDDELENIYHDMKSDDVEYDLYTTALRFRLLRQHGYRVSCEAFNMFKDVEGNFKASPASDVRGLLELYEASHMRIQGDDILEEAISFTKAQLTLSLPALDHPLSEQVDHALKQSIRRGLPRVEARKFISVYEDIESHNKALLQFAKIDFNLLQLLHRKELSEIYFYDSLKVVEGFGLYKKAAICKRQSGGRGDLKCMDQLPEYMQISYKALLDVYEEMEQLLVDQERQYRVEYARKAMIRLAQAYLLEAKWTHLNYKPTFEEFRDNALPTSGYAMLAITAFVGMGDVITPETFKWAANDPKIIKASTIICRFMDDIAEHKFNHRREDDCSAIECYMEQYGVTAQEAYDEFNKHIESSWKDVNEEFLKPTEMPTPVLSRSLNLARVMDVLYREGDGYTHVGKAAKGGITSLLIDAIPL
ncbi:(+)-delta-cadinene synthase isozyme A [Hibiscus syriacus]|uniref:(+)-delta-cadinene synthase n=1 Tax=Hibiscus syriacus TaxID=106335 RepID=A0A6A2ZRA3_HIBSY|nr:(+)-delta-cadinene synthase isozyme A [Hibiscus syriacus]